MVYILEFTQPIHHARYYVGYCDDKRLAARLKHHAQGTGAALTRAATERGIGLNLVAVWPHATRTDERRIKNRKNTPRLVARIRNGRTTDWRGVNDGTR